MSAVSIRPAQTIYRTVFTAIFVIAIGLMWTGTAAPVERVITLRYLLFALSGLTAFSTPYILFPDVNVSLIQLGNLDKQSLQTYIFNKIKPVTWPVILLFFVILFGDPAEPSSALLLKLNYFAGSSLLFTAIVLFSMARYVKAGPDSQFWKESEKGKKLRQDAANYFKYPMDPGSIPSLINTILVLLFGSLPIILGTVLSGYFPVYAETVLMLIMLGLGYRSLKSQGETIIRNYYSTNAFFREFFGSNLKGEEIGERREVEQLWWAPVRIRMHIWQFLVQLDRKIPSGRVAFAGHVLILFLAYQRPDAEFLLVAWILFVLLHHLFMIMTFQAEMAPGWLLRWIDSSKVWFITRFWMQLRWVIPLLAGMNVQYFIFGTPGFSNQAIVIGLFLLSSALLSGMGATALSKDLKT